MLEYAIAKSENKFFFKNMENLEYGTVNYSKFREHVFSRIPKNRIVIG